MAGFEVSTEASWAITRVSMQEQDTGTLDRMRWRVIALPRKSLFRSCMGSGEFDVQSLPADGPLAVRTAPSEVQEVTRVAKATSASRVIDVIAAPPGDVAAVVTELHIVLVRKVGSSWRAERTFRWKPYNPDDGILMAEWAVGRHASRWWTALAPFTKK